MHMLDIDMLDMDMLNMDMHIDMSTFMFHVHVPCSGALSLIRRGFA